MSNLKTMDLFNSSVNSSAKSFTLDKEFIDRIINELNQELISRNRNLEITVYGGSCLCILNKYRNSTYDIDLNSNDNKLLNSCIQSLGYPGDLVNTEMEVFINLNETLEVYKILSNLQVYVPTLDYLLALKIKSARDKDLLDCVNLCSDLNVLTVKDIKTIFCKFYSVVQFSTHRENFCKNVLKKLRGD